MAFPFQLPWGWMYGKRFRTLSPIDTTRGHHKAGGVEIPAGTIVVCTMVSGMGDVGVSTDLTRTGGYAHRAFPFELGRIEDEEYSYTFDMSDDPNFQNQMFRECYAEDIEEWTPEVLNRSWWGLPSEVA